MQLLKVLWLFDHRTCVVREVERIIIIVAHRDTLYDMLLLLVVSCIVAKVRQVNNFSVLLTHVLILGLIETWKVS